MVICVLPSSGAVFLADETTKKSPTLLLARMSQGGDGRTELEVEQQGSVK